MFFGVVSCVVKCLCRSVSCIGVSWCVVVCCGSFRFVVLRCFVFMCCLNVLFCVALYGVAMCRCCCVMRRCLVLVLRQRALCCDV